MAEVLTPKELADKVIDSMAEGKTQTEAMEELFLKNMREDEKTQYRKIKKTFTEFKKELEQKADYVSIIKKAENYIKTKTLPDAKTLANSQSLLHDLLITMERKELIVETTNQIKKGELVLSDNLKKYLFTNFHRTLSEIVIKLFLEPLPVIFKHTEESINLSKSLTLEEKDNKLKGLNKLEKSFEDNKLDLGDLLTIISTMEKNTTIDLGMSDLIKEAFSYVGGEVS